MHLYKKISRLVRLAVCSVPFHAYADCTRHGCNRFVIFLFSFVLRIYTPKRLRFCMCTFWALLRNRVRILPLISFARQFFGSNAGAFGYAWEMERAMRKAVVMNFLIRRLSNGTLWYRCIQGQSPDPGVGVCRHLLRCPTMGSACKIPLIESSL